MANQEKNFQGFQVIKEDELNIPKNPVENSNSITKTMQIKKDFRRNPQGDLQKDCMEIPLHPGKRKSLTGVSLGRPGAIGCSTQTAYNNKFKLHTVPQQ